MSRIEEYVQSRELIANLTLRELRSKYKKSVLGWTWSLLNPLATVLIFSVIFSVFLKVQPPTGHPSGLHSFALFLLCGLLPFNFVSGGLTMGTSSLVANSNLIKKVYFPREILVLSTTLSLLVTFAIEMGVLTAVLLVFGNMALPWIPMVLVLMIIEAFIMFGVGLMLSVFNVYFRDVQHLIAIALQALFYSAPIVYPIRFVPKHHEVLGINVPVRTIYELNPIVTLVQSFRAVLYDLRFPPVADIGYLVLWAAGLVALGLWVFHRVERRVPEEL